MPVSPQHCRPNRPWSLRVLPRLLPCPYFPSRTLDIPPPHPASAHHRNCRIEPLPSPFRYSCFLSRSLTRARERYQNRPGKATCTPYFEADRAFNSGKSLPSVSDFDYLPLTASPIPTKFGPSRERWSAEHLCVLCEFSVASAIKKYPAP